MEAGEENLPGKYKSFQNIFTSENKIFKPVNLMDLVYGLEWTKNSFENPLMIREKKLG